MSSSSSSSSLMDSNNGRSIHGGMKLILFGLSSGIGYAITKSVAHHYQNQQQQQQQQQQQDHPNLYYYYYTSFVQTIQSKCKKYIHHFHTKFSNSNLLLCSYLFYIMSTTTTTTTTTTHNASSTASGGNSGSTATSIINGTLPLLYCYIMNQQQQQQQQEKKKNDTNDNDVTDENNINEQPAAGNDAIDNNNENKIYRSRSNSVMTQTSEVSTTSNIETPKKNGSSNSNINVNTNTNTNTNANQMNNSTNKNNTRYLEMLVHNVSHTDLVLCLGIPNTNVNTITSNPFLYYNDITSMPMTRSTTLDKIMTTTTSTATTATTATTSTPRIKNKATGTVVHDDNIHDDNEYADNQHVHNHIIMKKKAELAAHALCRPRFSAFDIFCQRILTILQLSSSSCSMPSSSSSSSSCSISSNSTKDRDCTPLSSLSLSSQQLLLSSIMSFPRYERSDAAPRYNLVTPRPSRQSMLPVGMNLSQLVSSSFLDQGIKDGIENKNEKEKSQLHGHMQDLNISMNDLQSLRLRGKDVPKLESFLKSSSSRMYMSSSIPAMTSSATTIGTGTATSYNHPLSYSSPRVDTYTKKNHNSKDNIQKEENKQKEEEHQHTNDNDNDNDINIKTPLHLEAVFFPLLSSLLRTWSKQISQKYPTFTKKKNNNTNTNDNNSVKQVLILVTGVGTPRNWTHSMNGNSTQACAEIMEFFIKILYPHITVVKLHSEREIYRYDENIMFAQKELLPCVDAYRDAHARGLPYPDEVGNKNWINTTSTTPTHHTNVKDNNNYHDRQHFDPDWKQSFSVTLSFADGAPARTHAIQSALRPYRPTYFHFWQLKTFWHDSKICDADIEVHSFESMETVPAMEVPKTSSSVQKVVDEMIKFRQFFVKRLNEGDNDIRKFWLRKSKKPVLAVLLVNKPGQGLIMYRGTNMEVSMPTGSLCAERNVIGTALATDPGLRREDLIMVAVLAVPLQDENNKQSIAQSPRQLPSPPPVDPNLCSIIDNDKEAQGTSTSVFFSEVEEKLTRFQRPENIRRSMSVGSFASIIECDDSCESDESWVKDELLVSNSKGTSSLADDAVRTLDQTKVNNVPPIQEIIPEASVEKSQPTSMLGGASNPVRKIPLYADDGNDMNNVKDNEKSFDTNNKKKLVNMRRKKKRTVLVHSIEDINPLKPCGACNEWLKKIAESNPHFKIITFTDADCNGVYVTPCQE